MTFPSNQPNPNRVIDPTEIGRAEKFSNENASTHCFVSEEKQWHIFDGNIWKPQDQKKVLGQAVEYTMLHADRIIVMDDDEAREEAIANLRKYANRSGVSNIVEMAAWRLMRSSSEFDTDPDALAVSNGWIDLKTGRLMPSAPEKMFSLSASTNYHPSAEGKLWRKTVLEVFNNSKLMAEYFQRAVGYSLLGSNPEQLLFLCHGSGANGKSLLLETIRNVMGTYGQSMEMTTLMKGKAQSGQASPDLARLRGIRFALASETERGQQWSSNRIKTLTGGDTITARPLYKDVIEFRNQATIWAAMNHLPEVDASDEAMWRRIKLIPFNRVFSPEEQDVNLPQKLAEEHEGILAWMVQGLQMYRNAGLQEPPAVKEATSSYRDEMDSAKRFFDTQAIFAQSERTPVKDVRETYREWCREENLKPLAASQFNKALEDKGCRQSKSGSTRYWTGIKLRDPLEDRFHI